MALTQLEPAVKQVIARTLAKRDNDFYTTRIVIAVVCISVSIVLILVGAIVRNRRRKNMEKLLLQVVEAQAQAAERDQIPMTRGVGHANGSEEGIQKLEI
ncbi:hypothetical protein PT974_07403 [Cladobotryum mycophilum]|uniref:Uncharacterized protein n=1 Tax=Cladobotryum mycophilum TaxID=491253 RepID=A0ABR0SQG5_9HYPO